MTAAQVHALLVLASTWRAVSAAASQNVRSMHALGVRIDRVLAGTHIVEAAAKLAAELEDFAREVEMAATATRKEV